MRPVKAREVEGALILTIDDPASVNDGQTDLYRQSVYSAVEDRGATRVALDLGSIDFLSSSGVAMLVGLRRRMQGKAGQLALFGVQANVRDLLRMMKIAPLFLIAEDEAGAVALFSSSSPPH